MVALLEERDPEIVRCLTAAGIDIREVHAEIRMGLGTGDDRLWEGILVTPRVRKIVALAEARAQTGDVEPVDLYESLRAEGGSVGAQILRNAARQ